MYETFFTAALVTLFFAFLILDGALFWLAVLVAAVLATLGLLDGYGILPEWQGAR